MSQSPSPDGNSERLEQIVAYLDGELSPADSARVEQQLAADEGFREELQSIDRAWVALDELPSTRADDSFLQTTMEIVVDSARREAAEKTQALPMQRRKRRLATILFGVSAILLGMLAFRLTWSNPNRLLLNDLPVIYQLDIYSQFEQVNFLRMLHQGIGDQGWPLPKEDIENQELQLQLILSTENRRKWLSQMSNHEQVTLRANFNRFRGLPPAEQVRMRSLHREIDATEDSKELRGTLVRYEQWLNHLPASEQYSLREQPAAARAHRVVRMVHEKRKADALQLTPKQLQQFWHKMHSRLGVLERELVVDLTDGERERYQNLNGDPRRKYFFLMSIATPKQIKEHLLPAVLETLPREARIQFERLPTMRKREQLAGWWRQAQMLRQNHWQEPGRNRSGGALEKELEAFFVEELGPGDKERLLALPNDQMQRQLERMYRGVPSSRGRGGFPERDHRPPPGLGPPPGFERRPQDHHEDDHEGHQRRRGRRPRRSSMDDDHPH